MANWQQALYNRSPWFMKRELVAAEARRRNRYRRYGDYEACLQEYSFELYRTLAPERLRQLQLERLQRLLGSARDHCVFYRERIPGEIREVAALSRLPILTKNDIRTQAREILDPTYDAKQLWHGVTSGSTGTPLRFPVGREGIRARTAIQDNYYALHGCRYGDKRIRFGGAKIVPEQVTSPPFWIYNRPDRQLQMSAYHIDTASLPHYVASMLAFEPTYFTGYAHALYQVAQFLATVGGLPKPPRAVFTDSEGLPPHCTTVLQQGFGAPAYDVYGLGEVGWVAAQCRHLNYHVLELSCILEVVDEDGRPLPAGECGRLVLTDLTQTAFPYIRYDSGDMGRLSSLLCECGLQTSVLQGIEGRSDDLIVTPRGRKVGRLSHVTKPGRGILESQIAQTDHNRVVIRVVPAPNFDQASMGAVVHVAHELLGDEMVVDWELVESIPRTSRHKFKHVVRECKV